MRRVVRVAGPLGAALFLFVALLLCAAGCSPPKGKPATAAGAVPYFQVLPVSEHAGFTSKMYRLPGADRSLALADSLLLDETALDTVFVLPEERPGVYTVRVRVTPEGRERSKRILPAYQDRLLGIVVDGKLLFAPSSAEVAGEESLTVMQHLSQEDAVTLSTGLAAHLKGRKPAGR